MDDFIHIPKTSGSTLRTVLARQYDLKNIVYHEPGNPQLHGRDPKSSLKDELAARAVHLVTGHHAFGIHTFLYRPIRYFSFIRDPISRAASDYFFAYNYEHHRLRAEIINGHLTPEAFLIEGHKAGPFDLQCRTLSGRTDALAKSSEMALDVVKNCYTAVGVAELFDESILYMAKRLRWAPPLYLTRNVTRLPPEIEARRRRVEESVRSHFAERYSADIELHEKLTDKLRHEIQAEGAPFAQAFDAFKELQTLIAKANETSRYKRYEFSAADHLPQFDQMIRNSSAYRLIGDYLQTDNISTSIACNYVGHLDIVENRRVAGWAADLWRESPIVVRIYASGRIIGSAIANKERADVKNVCGIRSNVGFDVTLERDVSKNDNLYVCFENTRLNLCKSG